MVDNLEKAKVIQPYRPLFGSSCVTDLLHALSRTKSVQRNRGVYRYCQGEKSVIWYWKFDVEKGYFHQFKTTDYEAAMKYYEANGYAMGKGHRQ